MKNIEAFVAGTHARTTAAVHTRNSNRSARTPNPKHRIPNLESATPNPEPPTPKPKPQTVSFLTARYWNYSTSRDPFPKLKLGKLQVQINTFRAALDLR